MTTELEDGQTQRERRKEVVAHLLMAAEELRKENGGSGRKTHKTQFNEKEETVEGMADERMEREKIATVAEYTAAPKGQ